MSLRTTVKSLLMATSLQQPIFLAQQTVHVHINSFSTSLQWPCAPLYNGIGHESVSLTAKITSWQQPFFSATDEKVRNGHEIWSDKRTLMINRSIVFWLCSIHNAAVSINCLWYLFVLSHLHFLTQDIIQVVYVFISLLF